MHYIPELYTNSKFVKAFRRFVDNNTVAFCVICVALAWFTSIGMFLLSFNGKGL